MRYTAGMFGWLAIGTVASAGELDLEVSAEGFDLSVDADRSVQRLLSRMHGAYESWLGLVFPAQLPVRVTLVQSEPAYRVHEARAIGRSGHSLGFFVAGANEIVVWRGQGDLGMRQTLVHEASHYLMTVAGVGRVPLWLNEGMAEVFEGARSDGNAVWLDADPARVAYLKARPVPAASALMSGSQAWWTALGPTPWSRAEYPFGGALCEFLLGTDPGRRTLSDLLVSTAVSRDPGADALAAVGRSWPGGTTGLDAAFAAWLQTEPARIQLPIRSASGQADGWVKCSDGSLVRTGSGAKCGRWVKGADGFSRFREE